MLGAACSQKPPAPAQLVVSEDLHDFGGQFPGTSSPAVTFHLANDGGTLTDPLNLDTTGDLSSFRFDAGTCVGFRLPPGVGCDLTVTFAPLVAGPVRAEFNFAAGPREVGVAVKGLGTDFSPDNSTVMVRPDGGTPADGLSKAVVTVTVLDENSLPVSGVPVTIFATGSDDVLDQPSSPTDQNGITFGALRSDVAEVKQVTAMAAGVPLTGSASATFLPVAITGPASTLVASSSPQVADGVSPVQLTVQLVDDTGTPLAGKTVVFTSTGSGNTFQQPLTPTDLAGTASATLTSSVAESKTISALVNGAPLGKSATVVFVAGAATTVRLVVAPTDVLADGSHAAVLTTTVTDSRGNPVSGVTVSYASLPSDPTIIPGDVTDANGVTTATMTSTVPGTKVVTPYLAVNQFSPGLVTFYATPTVTSVSVQGSACIRISYTVQQSGSVPVDMLFFYQSNPTGPFRIPTQSRSSAPTTNVTTSPGGTAHTFTWNAAADFSGTAQLAVTAVPVLKGYLGAADVGTGSVSTEVDFEPVTGPVIASNGAYDDGVVADFDGDGFLDVALLQPPLISIYAGNGRGGLAAPVSWAVPCSGHLAAADVNGDGRPDLLCTASSSVQMLLSQPDGGFDAGNALPTPVDLFDLAVTDLNNDGIPDVVTFTGPAGGTWVRTSLGLPDGGYLLVAALPLAGQSPSMASGELQLADLNGDGLPDLFAATEVNNGGTRSNQVTTWLGAGDGTFPAPVSAPLGIWEYPSSRPPAWVVGDFTGDRVPDIATFDYDSSLQQNQLEIAPGAGDGTFGPHRVFRVRDVRRPGRVAADFNGDGQLDIAYQSIYDGTINSPPSIGVLLSQRDGGYADWLGPADDPYFYQDGIKNNYPLVADFNGDGRPDFAYPISAPPQPRKLNIMLNQEPVPCP